METLQTMIKQLLAMHFSQEEIAAQAKVSQMTISRWSKDEPRRQDMEAHRRLSKFLAKVRSEKEGA